MFVQADEATVGDRDAMGRAAERVQDLSGPAERALGEDHPGRLLDLPQAGGEGLGCSRVRQGGMEPQPPCSKLLCSVVRKSGETGGPGPYGQEGSRAGTDPARAIRRWPRPGRTQ